MGERRHLEPDIIVQTVDKVRQIREHLQSAQSRHKSWTDVRKEPLEFNVGDYVLLKISLTKGVIQFGVREKLSPKYIGPFEVMKNRSCLQISTVIISGRNS